MCDAGDFGDVRVCLGIPLFRTGAPHWKCFQQLMSIQQRGYEVLTVNFNPTEIARNMLAEKFLTTNYTHMLMLDPDHLHPVDIVDRLVKHVIQDPDVEVIAGLNFQRKPPYIPMMGILDERGEIRWLKRWAPGLRCVDAVGAASLMVSRRVYQDLDWPWFYCQLHRKRGWFSEDVFFCSLCWQQEIDIWIDTDVVSPHLAMSEYWVDTEMYLAYNEQNETEACYEN